MPWQVEFDDVGLRVWKDDDFVTLKVVHSRKSLIRDKGFLNGIPMPANWYEVQHLEKADERLHSIPDVFDFITEVVPKLFMLSGGHPLVWQCSARHSRYYQTVFRRSEWGCQELASHLVDVVLGKNDDSVMLLSQRKVGAG
jgi:hypothetical protein